METIRLTKYSHGAGCGCKISPKVLDEILSAQWTVPDAGKLIVGNHSRDDAAVYDIGNDQALIATTDFFMPIVDDPYDFGMIASANAISDVYAMGGKPILALAILGWPVEKLPASIAARVIEGARAICAQAGIPLAGGHSIDTPEPMFGLSVNGLVPTTRVKKNDAGQEGDLLFLTKKIGVGMLTTATKRDQLLPEHEGLAIEQMKKLNDIGLVLGEFNFVHAMTDVTGFGLGGHLIEMAEGSSCSAELSWSAIPFIGDLSFYIKNKIFPDAVYRNWNSFGTKVSFEKGVPVADAFTVLPDPQTNGGLLISVAPAFEEEMKNILVANGLEEFARPIGKLVLKKEKVLTVIP